MTRGAMRWLMAALAFSMFAGVSGCSTPPDSLASPDEPFVPLYEELLAQGREQGASPRQIATLETAIAENRLVTFEEYKLAIEDRIACLEALGFNIAERQEIQHPGWRQIQFAYGGLPAAKQTDSVLDAALQCNDTYALLVELAYQQGETVALTDAVFAKYRDSILNCLTTRGVSVDPGATRAEILAADHESTPAEHASCSESTGYVAAS